MFILSLQKAGKKMCETHVCKYITSTFLLPEKVAANSPLLILDHFYFWGKLNLVTNKAPIRSSN